MEVFQGFDPELEQTTGTQAMPMVPQREVSSFAMYTTKSADPMTCAALDLTVSRPAPLATIF